MSFVSPKTLFRTARQNGFAVGFFESWDLASLQGVIDAAEAAAAPVVIGFNGDFMSRTTRTAQERIEWYAALGRAAAESACVPCAVIFNECPRDEWVRAAVDTGGFNLVMPSAPHADPADYQRRVHELAKYAHAKGIAIEAEIGELPNGESGVIVGHGDLTDADHAREFAERTGVDLLAVSVGNVHIRLEGTQSLDLGLVKTLADSVCAGLVLHGGSGIPKEELRLAASLGVVKVNFGTYLKQAWLKAMREGLSLAEVNPHKLLGLGGHEDILVRSRTAVRDAVSSRLEYLGCVGMARVYEAALEKIAP